MGTQYDHGGAAVDTTLNANISNSDTSLVLDASTGWPSGGAAGSFWIAIGVIDTVSKQFVSNVEKILVGSRTGTTCSSLTRGADDTSAVSHTAGETIRHIFAEAEAHQASEHAGNTGIDDHSQYMMTDGTRHDLTARHTFGSALGTPGTPTALTPDIAGAAGSGSAPAREDHAHNVPAATAVSVGSANAEGTAGTFARSDHTHDLIALSVESGDLAADAVIAGKIADNAIASPAEFAAGVRPVRASGSTPSVDVQDGDLWYDTSTERLMSYDGTSWRIIGGEVPGAQVSGTTISSIPNASYGVLGFASGDVDYETDSIADDVSDEFDLPVTGWYSYSVWADSTSTTNFNWYLEARLDGTIINTAPWTAHNAILLGSSSVSGKVYVSSAPAVLDFRVFNGASSARDFRFRYGNVVYIGQV